MKNTGEGKMNIAQIGNDTVTQRKRKLPIGIDNFEKVRMNNFYYVDKTGLIIDLLNSWCEVTLFTRPRRFGKSLNLSMLEAFFSPDSDKSMFDGLKVSEEAELCEKYMGKYPVLFISLKNMDAGEFDTAYEQACQIIRKEAVKVDLLLTEKDRIHPAQRRALDRLLADEISPADLYAGLSTLSEILEKHYSQKTIVLIDEYDVPLAKAWEYGYYDQMLILIRSLFQQVLKTNVSVELAVLTGCMRVSKESIFTGLNNLVVRSITDEEYDEYFGFTDTEVRQMLEYYGFPEYYETIKDWYDGYRFGQTYIYCPWDVICYSRKLCTDSEKTPENYWMNSSGNSVVRQFIRQSGSVSLKGEIEALINGEVVEKTVHQELTYPDMYASVDNIWSVLFTTGYLTQNERVSSSRFKLVIPNREVRDIFEEQILELFREDVAKDGKSHERICNALENQDLPAIENGLGEYLRKTISIRDTAVRKSLKENFYHGILLAILGIKAGWSVTSNQEAGDGYSDILVRFDNYELAMIIEVKYAEDGDLDTVCQKALQQIEDKNYAQRLYDDGFEHILKYGIAFYLKKCKVMLSEL